jgi:hydroxymethylglutaryl-CoA lyase
MAGKVFDRFGVFEYFPSHSLPSEVKIHEVGPRDGLQNEPEILSTGNRIEFIERFSLP